MTDTQARAMAIVNRHLPEDQAAESLAERRTSYELDLLRARRTAKRLLDAEEHAAGWREPPSRYTLAEELALPDDPVAYRVDGLLPAGGNVLLTAQYKAGKTTLAGNLVKALADGKPFLGRFHVDPPDGRIAVFNYELPAGQYRRWLRDLDIDHPDRVSVAHLRGYRLPPVHEHVADWIVDWLVEREASVWVVDPFAKAFTGCGEENSNTDVGNFLDTLDQLKERAGIRELVLPVHTGRAEHPEGAERARGATRLDDWADARWLLTKDDADRRYLRADGRDVDQPEELLHYEQDTRSLTIGGWDRAGMRRKDLTTQVAEYVAQHPGMGVNEIVEGLGTGRTRTSTAIRDAVAEGLIRAEQDGAKRRHYPPTFSATGGDQMNTSGKWYRPVPGGTGDPRTSTAVSAAIVDGGTAVPVDQYQPADDMAGTTQPFEFNPADPTGYPLAGVKIGPAWRAAEHLLANGEWVSAGELVELMTAAGGVTSKTAMNLLWTAARHRWLTQRGHRWHTRFYRRTDRTP